MCVCTYTCVCMCAPGARARERVAEGPRMSSLSAQPACHKSRTYSVKLFGDVTHENAQAPSVLLIHYCVWENSRNTQITFQSVPLFSNGCMRFGFSPAPFFSSFSTTFLLSFSLPVKAFLGVILMFFSTVSFSPTVRLVSFLLLFILFPTFSLFSFLMFLLLVRVKSSEDLELTQALKCYSESQSEIVFPADHLFRPILLKAVFSPAPNFSSCDQYSNLSVLLMQIKSKYISK